MCKLMLTYWTMIKYVVGYYIASSYLNSILLSFRYLYKYHIMVTCVFLDHQIYSHVSDDIDNALQVFQGMPLIVTIHINVQNEKFSFYKNF